MDWLKNQNSLELSKSELMEAINYDCSCKEFLKFAQEDKKMLSSVASADKYIWIRTKKRANVYIFILYLDLYITFNVN
jgi:hypothetical protein